MFRSKGVRNVLYFLGMLLLMAGLSGCAALLKSPEISLAGVELAGLGAAGPRLMLKLNVRNPNAVALVVRTLDVSLELSGRAVARGALVRPVSIPASGEAVLDLQVLDSPSSVWRQVREAHQATGDKLAYRLFGRGELDKVGVVPFDRSGEVAPFLPGFLRKGSSNGDSPL